MKLLARTNAGAVLRKLPLVLLGTGIALGLLELLLRTNPNWVPRQVRVDPPVRRVQAFLDETYEVKLSQGDLFYWMRGTIAPLAPDKDRVVAHVHLTTDAYGFRNPPPEKPAYDLVALGDSFTRATGVANPWPLKLAEFTGKDVLNLGEVGAGPQQELKLLQQYGLNKRPQWVIMAYFEGNDLYDAAAYEQANPFILTRFGSFMLTQGLGALRGSRFEGAQAAVVPDYRYPITATINGVDLEMAFFSYYLAWLSAGRQAIESSQNFYLLRDTVLQVRELTEAAGARLLFVYLPSKSHVYLPYLDDSETVARVFADVPTLALDEAGFLQFTNQTATPELTRQHMDDQARLLADFAAAQGFLFLDLTPSFQAEAGTGAELYYPFDTHWNQSGHDLAAQTIAQYLEGRLVVAESQSRE